MFKKITGCIVLCFVTLTPAWSEEVVDSTTTPVLSGKDVMLLNEKSRKSVTEYSDIDMTLTNSRGQERKRKMKLRIDDSNFIARKTYIEFTSPKDVRGTRILTLEKEDHNIDADRWLYLPALRKIRRISGSDIGESFVGTDFAYEDMDINDGVVNSHHYSYTIIREEEKEDATGVVWDSWVVEAIPVTEKRIKESSYSKRHIWVAKKYHTAIHEEYYNKDGEHYKTRTSSDVSKFFNSKGEEVWRPNRIEMIDHEKNQGSVIVFDQTIDKPIDKKVFTKRFLNIGL